MAARVIMGIDPGLRHTGWGVVDVAGSRFRCLAYGCITTRAAESLPARLKSIHEELVHIIKRYSVTESAVESVFVGMNVKSALALGQARGVSLLALASTSLSFTEYSPAQIKSAVVGVGRADKHQVAFMAKAILGLESNPRPDHAADALAVAICHANQTRVDHVRDIAP